MKKLLMLLPILAISGLCAKGTPTMTTRNDVDVQKELDGAKVIRFSITIYRNETEYDKDAWKDTVQKTANIIELGSHEGDDAAFVDGIVKSIQGIVTRSGNNDGIHGEIKVGLGDGVCACADGCDCATKYNGLCPCGALAGSDCKSEKLKCPGHPTA